MSCKISNNSLKLNCDSPQWIKTPNLDTSVKLAGEESKDRLYEPKHKKKLVRVLTVVAYVFFVSLAGIMLSLYYVFLWNGYEKEINYHKMKTASPEVCTCPFEHAKHRIIPGSTVSSEDTTHSSTTEAEDIIDVNTETEDSTSSFQEGNRRNFPFKNFFHKKIFK